VPLPSRARLLLEGFSTHIPIEALTSTAHQHPRLEPVVLRPLAVHWRTGWCCARHAAL
jgi:hypothetical protein